MNHDAIAKALCGRYTRLSDASAYIESNLASHEDGGLLGAYVMEAGEGRYLVTDDGDTTFRAMTAGADITPARLKRYRKLAELQGLTLNTNGALSTSCDAQQLPYVLANFINAAGEIAALSVAHRPKDAERFEAIVASGLKATYPKSIIRRPKYNGISGHQISFPFGLRIARSNDAVIQPIASSAGKLLAHSVYEAGGKFKDVRGAHSDLRLIAVLENSEGVDWARKYFSDMADVVVYSGGPLQLVA